MTPKCRETTQYYVPMDRHMICWEILIAGQKQYRWGIFFFETQEQRMRLREDVFKDIQSFMEKRGITNDDLRPLPPTMGCESIMFHGNEET